MIPVFEPEITKNDIQSVVATLKGGLSGTSSIIESLKRNLLVIVNVNTEYQ